MKKKAAVSRVSIISIDKLTTTGGAAERQFLPLSAVPQWLGSCLVGSLAFPLAALAALAVFGHLGTCPLAFGRGKVAQLRVGAEPRA